MTQANSPNEASSEIDSRNRHIAQEAGLDQDLESQVPARYDNFTVTILSVILIALVAVVIWIAL